VLALDRLHALPWRRLAARAAPVAAPCALVAVPTSLVVPAFARMFREVGVSLPALTQTVLEGHALVGCALVATGAGAALLQGPRRARAIGLALLAAAGWPLLVGWALLLPLIELPQKL
jgi:hypothetical protein